MRNRLIAGACFLGLSSFAGAAPAVRYQVTETPGGVRHAGPATSVEHQGLKILHLYGTREEMARQHGAFVRGQVEMLALDHFAHGLREMTEVNLTGARRMAATFALDNYFYPMLRAGLTQEEKTVYAAFAQEAQMKEEDMLNAVVYPDLGEILMAQIWKSERASAPGLGFGCTTAIVPPAYSSENGLIHARDLDFHGEGAFERNNAILYFHPSEPGMQEYASVTTLGVHPAGPTVFNASGIIADLHQLTSSETSVFGRPVLMVMEHLIRNARTLDEAIRILKTFKYTSPWKINLSSAREGRIALVEVSASRFAVEELTRTGLFETNHAHFDEFKKNEFFPGFRYAEDSVLRRSSAEASVIEALSGGVSAQEAIDAISLTRVKLDDGRWESRTIHGTTSRMDFGKANEGRFIAVPMSFATDPDHTSRSLLAKMPKTLVPESAPSEARAQAHAHYRLAYAEYAAANEFVGALRELRAAAALEPEEALYPLMIGLTQLRAGGIAARDGMSEGNIRYYLGAADESLRQAAALGLSPYHRSLSRLLRGELSWALGSKDAARALFEQVDPSFSTGLARELKAARKAVRAFGGGISAEKFAGLGIDYVSGDVTKF